MSLCHCNIPCPCALCPCPSDCCHCPCVKCLRPIGAIYRRGSAIGHRNLPPPLTTRWRKAKCFPAQLEAFKLLIQLPPPPRPPHPAPSCSSNWPGTSAASKSATVCRVHSHTEPDAGALAGLQGWMDGWMTRSHGTIIVISCRSRSSICASGASDPCAGR